MVQIFFLNIQAVPFKYNTQEESCSEIFSSRKAKISKGAFVAIYQKRAHKKAPFAGAFLLILRYLFSGSF
jgi:hypothetical protein